MHACIVVGAVALSLAISCAVPRSHRSLCVYECACTPMHAVCVSFSIRRVSPCFFPIPPSLLYNRMFLLLKAHSASSVFVRSRSVHLTVIHSRLSHTHTHTLVRLTYTLCVNVCSSNLRVHLCSGWTERLRCLSVECGVLGWSDELCGELSSLRRSMHL